MAKTAANKVEIYGVAYQSPAILYYLVSAKKYFPVMVQDVAQVRSDLKTQLQKNTLKKLPVIIAGNLTVAQAFVKQYPDLNCKLVMFDYPSLLLPKLGPQICWLDCDHQPGGAWQISKLMPEEFNNLLDKLAPLSEAGRKFLLAMVKLMPVDRTNEIEAFATHLPKSYKDLLASPGDGQKSPLKLAKEGKKSKESFRNILIDGISSISGSDQRKKCVNLVLDYQLGLVGKKDFQSKMVLIVREEQIKKDLLGVRKWIDSKAGAALQDAYFDYVVNKERRSWATVLAEHKKVHEEDLVVLLSHLQLEGAPLQHFTDKVASFAKLPSDKAVPKAPFHPDLVRLAEVFQF